MAQETEKRSSPAPKREPLAVVKPSKPLGDMTSEELDRFADQLWAAMMVNLAKRK